jgi:hypothetical protein
VAGPRDYTRSTLMALAILSGGLCYYLGCPEEVVREVEEQFCSVADIAHIKAAYPNGARYDAQMTDDERRALKNLILLCEPHHFMVDNLRQTDYYTVELLTRWKEQREADPSEALARLREVTPSGLRKIVAEGLARRDSQLLDALERLESNDHVAATLMRTLLDELTEAYSQLNNTMLNPHLIADLFEAASTLGDMKSVLVEFITVIQTTDFRRLPRPYED